MTKLRIVFDITPITSKPVTGIGQIIENLVAELSGMENVDLVPFALTARANLWQLKMRYPKLLGPQIPARLLRTAEYLINSLHVPLDLMIGSADAVISVDWFCPRLMHGKTVAVIADCTPVTHPQWYDARTVKRYKTRLKTMERDADLVVAISQATRKALLKHTSVIKSKILVAYPGLPKSFSVYPSQQMMTAVRVRYGLPEEYLLFVGSENPRKNLTGLVNAMGKLKIVKDLTLPPLVVAGDESWGATKYPSYIVYRKVRIRSEPRSSSPHGSGPRTHLPIDHRRLRTADYRGVCHAHTGCDRGHLEHGRDRGWRGHSG